VDWIQLAHSSEQWWVLVKQGNAHLGSIEGRGSTMLSFIRICILEYHDYVNIQMASTDTYFVILVEKLLFEDGCLLRCCTM
jgi:hypothetical protein